MNPVFTINFRREAWLRERARARGRLVALGVWFAYFGVMAVILGLYGLNALTFARRVESLERQVARERAATAGAVAWNLAQTDLQRLEAWVANPSDWRARFERMGALVPPDVRLLSVALNPQNVSGASTRVLVLRGEVRGSERSEQLRSVMGLVSALHADSVFSAQYRNIRLVSTAARAGAAGAEFTIECR
jgi:hypothetical protein